MAIKHQYIETSLNINKKKTKFSMQRKTWFKKNRL